MEYRSHIGQDRWVDETYGAKESGYFLDFGAFDGVTISNTYMLEVVHGWSGICVEPNPSFFPTLCRNRTAIAINCALFKESRKKLSFVDAHGLSGFEFAADNDSMAERRAAATKRKIFVDTLNPTELLDRFDAPTFIEYLSLDVEGCELDILRALDFSKYKVGLMTIEHNHDTERQQKIRNYLANFGYRVLQNRNDDFFFRLDVAYARDPVSVFTEVYATWQIKE